MAGVSILCENNSNMATDNYLKHTSKNPLQKFLINRFYSSLLNELIKIVPSSILDVGCGEGFTLARIRNAGIKAVLEGVDIRPEAINLGQKLNPELTLRTGNIYQLPYADNSFDAVLCSEVLEHLDDPERALAELRRVIRKYCIISVPNEPLFRIANFLRGKNITRLGNDIEHIQHWSSRGIADLIGNYFSIKTIRTPFPWTVVVGEKRA